MRILALTDIHGAYATAQKIMDTEERYDVVVIGGDLTTFGSPPEAEQAILRFQQTDKPLLVVSGNMDPPELDRTFDGLGVLIDSRGRSLNNVGFFGISGAPLSPLNTPYEISEEEIARRATAGWNTVSNVSHTVFVPHAPPFNTTLDRIASGTHVGSRAVRRFIEAHQPDLVICGHIHESMGTDTIGSTTIVNCGPAGRGHYVIADVGEETRVELRSIS
jgi:Icc-related predicted phosphoesterase